jgi:hypothetical protein
LLLRYVVSDQVVQATGTAQSVCDVMQENTSQVELDEII